MVLSPLRTPTSTPRAGWPPYKEGRELSPPPPPKFSYQVLRPQSVNGGMREKGERGERGSNSVGGYAKSPGSLIAPSTGCFNEGVAIFVKLTGRGTYSKLNITSFGLPVGLEDETAICFTSSSPPSPRSTSYPLEPISLYTYVWLPPSHLWPSLIFPPLSISHLL